ncbi:MAG: transporter, partial [Bradyrhizobium sp.]|nr:transporter [Bradyrhizobium sp.]
FMVGVAEAPAFPANARIVAAWFPTSERGTASAIFNAAQYFAIVAFAPLMGWLVHDFGWRSVFVVMGLVGLVAAAIFARYIRSPLDHPGINRAEFAYIENGGALVNLEDVNADSSAAFNWHNVRQILTSRMLIGVYLGQYCINALTYFFATWFPIYLVQQRHLSIMDAGFTAVAPALCGFAGGVLGGVISDHLLKKTGSVTYARKAPLLAGMLLATIIIACNFVDQQWLIILFMSLAFFGKGVASLGWAVVSDTTPKELAGVTGSIFNSFGNAAGIVTPIVIGYLVAATGSFDSALLFIGAHCVVTILAYFLIVGKIERLELRPAEPA